MKHAIILEENSYYYTGKRFPWNPVKETPGDFRIESFNHSFDGLEINLSKIESSEDIKLKIRFPFHACVARVMDELLRGRLTSEYSQIREFYKKHPEEAKNRICGGPIYVIEDSLFLKELDNESYGLMIDGYGYKHYFIEDLNFTFDVASSVAPKIEVFKGSILIDSRMSFEHPDLTKDSEI